MWLAHLSLNGILFLFSINAKPLAQVCEKNMRTSNNLSSSLCAIEFEENKCSHYKSALIKESKPIDSIIDCNEKNQIISKDALKSCGYFAGALALNISRSSMAAAAGGLLSGAFLGLILSNSIERSAECFSNLKEKERKLNELTNLISEVENKYHIELKSFRPHRFLGNDGIKRLKEASCEDINKYLYDKMKGLKIALNGEMSGLFDDTSSADSFLESLDQSLMSLGVHFKCLNLSERIALACEALGMGLGASIVAKALVKKDRFSKLVIEDKIIAEGVKSLVPKRMRTALPIDTTMPTQIGKSVTFSKSSNGSRPKNSPNLAQTLDREIDVANDLSRFGYKVEFRKHQGGARKSADLNIEGRVFDIYSPRANVTIDRIIGHTVSKVRNGQTNRVVLDLKELPHSSNEIRIQFLANRPDLQGLKEVIGVTKEGTIVQIFP